MCRSQIRKESGTTRTCSRSVSLAPTAKRRLVQWLLVVGRDGSKDSPRSLVVSLFCGNIYFFSCRRDAEQELQRATLVNKLVAASKSASAMAAASRQISNPYFDIHTVGQEHSADCKPAFSEAHRKAFVLSFSRLLLCWQQRQSNLRFLVRRERVTDHC